MATTVPNAFNAFRKDTVDLDAETTSIARKSRDYLIDQLTRVSLEVEGFPRLTGGWLGFGSFARSTKDRPLDDIDILILANGKGTTESTGSSDPYTFWLRIDNNTAPLSKFPDEHGYVNSTKVLNKIKAGLSSVGRYKKAEIKKNMEAVVLDLTSYEWSFDIVPAVPIDNGSGAISHFLIPNGRGDWKRTDPRIDASLMASVSKRHRSLFRPIVRLVKYWNERPTKPVLQSYHLETMAIRIFEYTSPMIGFQDGLELFFSDCPARIDTPCPDPKGLGPPLDVDLPWDTRNKIKAAMKESLDSIKLARLFELYGNQAQAINCWRSVFGKEFPAYG